MIVPMKKVSLIILGDKKEQTLRKLRKLGLLHIEITEGRGERLSELKEKTALLESAIYTVGKNKKVLQKELDTKEALSCANEIISLAESKKDHRAEQIALRSELERLAGWGELDPEELEALSRHGVGVSLYEMPRSEFDSLSEEVSALVLERSKNSVKFLLQDKGMTPEQIRNYRLKLPQTSTDSMRKRIEELDELIKETDGRIEAHACHTEGMKKAIRALEKEIEFEVYATGMKDERLSDDEKRAVSVAYFTGYIEAENLERLQSAAKENSWGLISEDPDEEDNVPTKLKNNRFVSLIYPLTDFLGTVPGYFEYDISGWFLAFILIFFGIIFGDGGYGLFICTLASVPIIRSLASKKPIPPTFLLIGLFGLSTVIFGTLTCTWFGLPPERLPAWLKSLSVPLISNVYADKIWYPFWTHGKAGLTTAQNLQIFCFTLALIQLTVAHIKVAARNRGKLKMLGDIGSILQLLGIYYLVLSLVVNSEVFTFSLVLGGVPVGTVAIALIGVGFVLGFVFSNYEGSIGRSVLASLKNIVSVLLGVVNVFSDIVSYIRLWAVGLAGAAIASTVNALAGKLFGNFIFMILAIVLLVFGHGLNMILNILSVIVHGIRLNTLEFSSHLNMSWSGHKFKPFTQEIDNKGETS